MTLTVRAASLADAEAIAAIYNQGIADRIGTFEIEPRTKEQIEPWFDGRHPIVVVEDAGEVVAFASTSSYRNRPCYAGVAEFSVYVARNRRGSGAGRLAMTALLDAAEAAGFWKMLSRISLRTLLAAHSWPRLAFARSVSTGGTVSWTAYGGIA